VLKVNRRFGGKCRPYHKCRIRQARNQREADSRKSYLLQAFILLGLIFLSQNKGDILTEKSIDFQWTTRYYISADRTPQDRRFENLKTYTV
jgi:hypothetical protein